MSENVLLAAFPNIPVPYFATELYGFFQLPVTVIPEQAESTDDLGETLASCKRGSLVLKTMQVFYAKYLKM